jgi:N-acetylmuramoyl-L-alanine amidase|tara:strand:+ start:2236 stop:2955 length:720 start_codon:yes stop_codon:yes gene_type:complete
MKFTIKNSPNFSKKSRKPTMVSFIIIHYTGMQSKRASVERLTNPKYKVSCHYLICRKGEIIQMVSDKKIAWHAGKSKWKHYNNLNKNSIGIELVNKGHKIKYEKFTKLQINSLKKLCNQLKKKFKIKDSSILGHSDIAPLRKEDPGEQFPWEKIIKINHNLNTNKMKKKFTSLDKKKLRFLFFKNLFKIGYRYFNQKKYVPGRDKKIIKAFQRKHVQQKLDGLIDQKTYEVSHFLAKLS